MSDPVRRFSYIDALRGYAILLVIAVHTSQLFSDLPGPLATILNQGARGVQLFFVTSAFTLSLSWVARHETAADFFMRRLFRIAPMFWIAIIFFLWLNGVGPSTYAPEGLGLRQIVLNVLLAHGFWPDTMSSVVPGGWSVADEVIFYLLFPLMVPPLLKASWRSLFTVAVIAIVVGAQVSRLLEALSYLFLPSSLESIAGIYFSQWFPRQLPCFIFGVALFKFSTERDSVPEWLAKSACVLGIALMLVFPFLEGVKHMLPLGLATSYGIAFSLFVFSLMYWPASPLVSSAAVWIGKVSYSAYFVHFAVLYRFPPLPPTGLAPLDFAIVYAMVVASTVAISFLTYRFIETPMIRLGSTLIEARRALRIRPAKA
ncbi:MAG TPA: acyltransferase [Bradyrhizobium sp.]|nr:acyltransferase [Bradyrhizobium sp.]